jgi:hypothetical protein
MQKYNKNLWQTKIDPALNKPIKAYVTFLARLERAPHDGLPSFPDELVESITKNSRPQGLSLEGSFKDCIQHIQKAGLASKTGVNNILKLIESIDDREATIKLCSKLMENLPEEESRRFYANNFKTLAEQKKIRKATKLSGKDFLDYFSVVFSLLVRYMNLELEGGPIDEKSTDHLITSSALAIIFSSILSTFSQIANQQTLEKLRANFAKGDDKSLFKAITIDKSLLYNRAAKKRIIQAQLSGDNKFFSKLGKAISDNPLQRVGQHGKTYTILSLFWLTGLHKLTAPELHSFLESCGLIPPSLEGGAFYKFLARHIKPLFQE